MKTFFVSFLLIFTSFQSFADCGASGIWAWPQNGNISKVPLIMLTGYYHSESIIREIDANYAAYLKSTDHVVRLKPQEICVGEMHLTQVLLKPLKALHIGAEYQLYIVQLPLKASDPLNMETLDLGSKPIKWTVTKGNDINVPRFTSPPTLKLSTIAHYGCGPAKNMTFDFKSDASSALLIKTNLTNLTNNKSTTFYLQTNNDQVKIGHDMCSGAFAITENSRYKIEFTLLDANWNYGEMSTLETTYNPVQQ